MEQFNWEDISVVFLGKTIAGIQSVKYSKEREKTLVYGRGSRPLAVQSGTEKAEGELVILQSEFDALMAAAKTLNPRYSITDITFDIVVSYARSGLVVRDIIRSASISKWEKSMKHDDPFMEITLPFIALGIDEAV